jgi:hypothetical protein
MLYRRITQTWGSSITLLSHQHHKLNLVMTLHSQVLCLISEMMEDSSKDCIRIVSDPVANCAAGSKFDAGYYYKGLLFVAVCIIDMRYSFIDSR